MTVLRHYSLQAAAGRETDLGDALAALGAQVRACAGCAKVELLVDTKDPAHFVFIEYWHSGEDRDAAGAALGKAAFAPVFATLAERPEARDLAPHG